MKKTIFLLALFILSIACYTPHADENIYAENAEKYLWFFTGSGGVLVYTWPHAVFGGYESGLCLQSEKNLLSIEITGSYDLDTIQSSIESQIELLYGRALRFRNWRVSLSTGFNLVDFMLPEAPDVIHVVIFGREIIFIKYNPTNGTYRYKTIGIPIQTGISFIPLNFAGIGLYLTANFTLHKLFASGSISILLGKLR